MLEVARRFGKYLALQELDVFGVNDPCTGCPGDEFGCGTAVRSRRPSESLRMALSLAMQPDVAPDQPPRPPYPQLPRITRRSVLVGTALLVVVVFVAVLIAQVYSRTEQGAENWITGLAAAIAAGNVLLTFYLLRVAQTQLGILRDDLHEQGVRHERELKAQEARLVEEANQYRTDLANTHALLMTQTEALVLARSDAQEAQQETAKSRLDLIAPRCSIVPASKEVTCYGLGTNGADLIREDTELPKHIDNLSISVSIGLQIRNWGDEPVTYFLGGGLISPTGYFLLAPSDSRDFVLEIRHSVREWMAISNGTASVDRRPVEAGRSPTWLEITVPVTNLSAEVNDEHKWGAQVMPIAVEEFRVIVRGDGSAVAGHHEVAIRKRVYAALRPNSAPAD